MKYLVITDNHYEVSSSVILKRGEEYSSRLLNQGDSLRWAAAFNLPILHLGDFFNKEILNAEEISYLKELSKEIDFSKWTFLQGNHGYAGGFDVLNIFKNQIISRPSKTTIDGMKVLFLPFRSKPEDIDEKFDLILGHVGVEGIPFGAKGFDPDLLSSHCKLFLNGHLHNKTQFRENCWNIGSLTAQNFSDDGYNNEKGAWILDMETLTIEFKPNPYAFNFYKMDEMQAMTYAFPNISNACISVTCSEEYEEPIRKRLADAYYLRMNVKKAIKQAKVEEKVSSIDYLEKFKKSFIEKNGESAIILDELAEVTQC